MIVTRRQIARLLGVTLMAATSLSGASHALAEGDSLRVGVLADINGFDPQSFLTVNFPIIKNFYDSLIEYTPEGEPVPSLATKWEIADDNRSVTVTLRDDVSFASGNPLNADAVAATLEKAADPDRGKNVYATMSFVQDWEVIDPLTIRLNFKNPAPERQITDLLQFLAVIDPAGMDTVDSKPAGTGAYVLAERSVGQEIRMQANPDYWREGEPVTEEVVITIFSEDGAASAALESGAIDLIYGGSARSAVRLEGEGYQLVRGPGPLTQVFRINSTKGPFRNQKFRQAFNYLMPRPAILKIGYAGLGQVTALPWAPNSPAADPAYNDEFAYNPEKAKELLAESGLSAEEMSDWKILVNGGDENLVTISQLVQNGLAGVGINVDLDIRQGAEYVEALLGGDFAAVFGAIGNVQKFPSRVATNSIYRTANNPVLGDPHPHPAYVEAIERVNNTFDAEAVKDAYDNLNRVLVEEVFAVPTNTYDVGLIVASPSLSGFTTDVDNMLVARTIKMGE